MHISCNTGNQFPNYKAIILYFYILSKLWISFDEARKTSFFEGLFAWCQEEKRWNASQMINLGGSFTRPNSHELLWRGKFFIDKKWTLSSVWLSFFWDEICANMSFLLFLTLHYLFVKEEAFVKIFKMVIDTKFLFYEVILLGKTNWQVSYYYSLFGGKFDWSPFKIKF